MAAENSALWVANLRGSPMPSHAPLIRLRQLSRTFAAGGVPFTALHPLDLEVAAGTFLAVVGRSGSGKSTLLHLLAGIERPSGGTIDIGCTRVDALTESTLAAWRGRNVGVVFQAFQLLPTLTVAENVMLPMDFCGTATPRAARARALALLDLVGVADQAEKLPTALSGGQQQRAAIARALANDPPIVVADEPTGNLDSQTSAAVLALLRAQQQAGKTVVLVTHDREIAAHADRTLTLADGRVVADTLRAGPPLPAPRAPVTASATAALQGGVG